MGRAELAKQDKGLQLKYVPGQGNSPVRGGGDKLAENQRILAPEVSGDDEEELKEGETILDRLPKKERKRLIKVRERSLSTRFRVAPRSSVGGWGEHLPSLVLTPALNPLFSPSLSLSRSCELSFGGNNQRECVKAMGKNCLHVYVRLTGYLPALALSLSGLREAAEGEGARGEEGAAGGGAAVPRDGACG